MRKRNPKFTPTLETVDGSLSSSHDSIELKIAEENKNKSRVGFADIDVSIIPPTVEPSRCSAPGSSIMANRHSMASFWSLSWSRLNLSGSRRSETSLRKSILSYVQSIWDGRLFKFTDLPEWMRDNEYITDMHRPQIKNLRSCIRSIFRK